MAKKKDSIFELLIELPWWVSVIFAGLVYFTLSVLIPSIEFDSPLYDAMKEGGPAFAPWLAFFFLMAAPLSLLKAKNVSKRGRNANAGLVEALLVAPWWATFTVGTVILIGFYAFKPEHLIPLGFALGGLFLLASFFSAIHAKKKRMLLDKQESITSIRELNWQKFEELVGEAYRRLGYQVTENILSGADGGVDLRLEKDGRTTLVQCKQWRNQKVGVKTVREMYGIMVDEQADDVTIICTGAYTRDAERFAQNKPIRLVSGEALQNLVSSVQASPNFRDHASSPKQPVQQRTCNRCGSQLVVRTAKRGINAGNDFYGCSNFPKCRYTEPSNVTR